MKEGRPTHNDDMVMFGMLVAKHGIETAAGTMVLVTATRVSKRMKVHEVADVAAGLKGEHFDSPIV